ncbi:MAG: hypothetical protein CMC13_00240 [Flavobacteriaceae bacterium]|nr:hypothetical protein [Flavobacteriaceae bacterium]|tara:strand:- start:11964 stop:12317 length:354 start_codon:yes stop_codon:yes gene_type:complete
MYNALLFLKEQLVDNSTITNEVPAENIYPLIAAAKVDINNFMVFSATREGRFTKDKAANYNAEVRVFASNLLEAARISDIVEEELTNHNIIFGNGARATFTEDYKNVYISLIFTFKI